MAEQTMVERVARALALAEGARFSGPGQSNATREFGWKGDGVHFEQYAEAHWRYHVLGATMALGAMREPTERMVRAGEDIDSVPARWSCMINEALNEPIAEPSFPETNEVVKVTQRVGDYEGLTSIDGKWVRED